MVFDYSADTITMVKVRRKNGELTTDYWSGMVAATGSMYLSWSDGYADLLVPSTIEQAELLFDWVDIGEVIISRGQLGKVYGFEIMLIASSGDEYSYFTLFDEQSNYIPAPLDQGRWVFNIWGEHGKRLTLPARYREVDMLPCLEQWCEH
ncbi:MAG TPA: hypothetical protein HPP72_14985 [Gammaproteobacteria bacterium]|jgi:hypothetical protein|nr:hypothetical protein [Gammaproteobacteria bacterium]